MPQPVEEVINTIIMTTPQTQIDPTHMSDDDMASALGYITTLSEGIHGLNQPQQDTSGQEPVPATPNETQPETAGQAGTLDSRQEKEIAQIRQELEALKTEVENGPTDQTSQNTATPQ